MKKLDKIALIVGISSLVFALGFGIASCVTAYRTFKDNGGWSQVKNFFSEKMEDAGFEMDSKVIFIDTGNDDIQIGPDGLHITDGEDSVVIGNEGIIVDSGDGDHVEIGISGISVEEGEG